MVVTKKTITNRLSLRTALSIFKRIFKEDMGLVYTTIGGLSASVLGALFWLILASLLSVADYGLANYYISLASLFAGVGTIGLNMTITTYLAKGERNILFEANSLVLASGFVTALVLSFFQAEAGLTSIAMVFFTMSLGELLGKKSYKEYGFLQIGQKLAQIALSMLLYYQIGLMGIVLGYFLGALIFSYRYLFSLRNITTKLLSLKEKRGFAANTFGFNLVGMVLPLYLDKIIIGAVFGYYSLGLYQLGFQFFMFLNIIPVSLQQYLLSEESSGNNRRNIKIFVLCFTTAMVLAIIALTPYLVTMFFPTFKEAISLISLMSLAVIPSTIAAIFVANFLGNEKSKPVLTGGIIYLALLIVGFITLGTVVGILGLALAVITAKTGQAIYLYTKR